MMDVALIGDGMSPANVARAAEAFKKAGGVQGFLGRGRAALATLEAMNLKPNPPAPRQVRPVKAARPVESEADRVWARLYGVPASPGLSGLFTEVSGSGV